MEKVPKSNCPTCDNKLDAVTGVNEDTMPEPGDVTICAYCASIMMFGEGLALRLLEPEELHTLPLEVQNDLKRAMYAIWQVRGKDLPN